MPSLRGFGDRNFGEAGFGLTTVDVNIEAENQVNLDAIPLSVVKKAPTQTILRQVKIKNIGSGLVTLNRLTDIPNNLKRFPIVLRIAPQQTATIAIEAYNVEQLRSLRNRLQIVIDPVR